MHLVFVDAYMLKGIEVVVTDIENPFFIFFMLKSTYTHAGRFGGVIMNNRAVRWKACGSKEAVIQV